MALALLIDLSPTNCVLWYVLLSRVIMCLNTYRWLFGTRDEVDRKVIRASFNFASGHMSFIGGWSSVSETTSGNMYPGA